MKQKFVIHAFSVFMLIFSSDYKRLAWPLNIILKDEMLFLLVLVFLNLYFVLGLWL